VYQRDAPDGKKLNIKVLNGAAKLKTDEAE